MVSDRVLVQAVEKSKEQIEVIRDVKQSLSIDGVKERASNMQTMASLQKMREEVTAVFGSDEK